MKKRISPQNTPEVKEFLDGLAEMIADDIFNESKKLENGNPLKIKGLGKNVKIPGPIFPNDQKNKG